MSIHDLERLQRKKMHKWKYLLAKTLDRDFWDEEELPRRYSSQLRRFLSRLLAIEPIDRMDSKDALRECIDRYREWLSEREESEEEDV